MLKKSMWTYFKQTVFFICFQLTYILITFQAEITCGVACPGNVYFIVYLSDTVNSEIIMSFLLIKNATD